MNGGRQPGAVIQSCARFLNMVVYSRTAENEEWKLMNAAPIFFDGGQCSATGLSTLFLEDGSQKYVLRLPQIQVLQMRVFLVCSTHKDPAGTQGTFYNTGHVYKKGGNACKPLPTGGHPSKLDLQFRTVSIQLLTEDTSFKWGGGVTAFLQSELDRASTTSTQAVNCTAVNQDDHMGTSFAAWMTPTNGRFRQNPHETQPPRVFKSGNQTWQVFASKKRDLQINSRYYVEKRMVCVQATQKVQQCCVSKSLHFKRERKKQTAEASLQMWQRWEAKKIASYQTAIAELRNF